MFRMLIFAQFNSLIKCLVSILFINLLIHSGLKSELPGGRYCSLGGRIGPILLSDLTAAVAERAQNFCFIWTGVPKDKDKDKVARRAQDVC